MGRQWNNGDLSQLRTTLSRESIKQQVSIDGATEPLFDWLRTTTPAEWVTGTSDAQPSLPAGGHRKHATWTDPRFAQRLFAGGELIARWYTTRVDTGSRRVELFFVVGDDPLVLGTLTIGVVNQSAQQSVLECELTCLSQSSRGNELMDAGLRDRMAALPDLIGEHGSQAVDRGYDSRVGQAQTGTPVHRSVQASHEVVVREPELVLSPNEAFLLACPVAELKWIEQWCFDLLHSESGLNERHCVFTEAQSSLFLLARKGKTTWTTVEFDCARRRFTAVLITTGVQIGLFEFSVVEGRQGQARLRWELTFSPTSPDGEALLAEPQMQRNMREMQQALQSAVVHYMRTKTLYRSPIHAKVHLVGSRLATRVHRHFAS